MRKNSYRLFLGLCVLLIAISRKASAQCSVGFNYVIGANGVVTFSSTSSIIGTASYTWTYGNSSSQTIVGTTTASSSYYPGTYTVSLAAGSVSCAPQVTAQVITVPSYTCSNVTAFNFSYASNGVVNFSNTSSPMVSNSTFTWTFGDGNGSYQTHPSATYTSNGSYTVSLSGQTGQCVSVQTAVVTVTNVIPTCNLNASFTYTNNGSAFSFISTSTGTTGATTYTWNYGDGTTGSGPSSNHTYTLPGNYNVLLRANNNGSVACIDSLNQVINVPPGCSLVASFTHTAGAGGNVNFSSNSVGTTSASTFLWKFGDGFTSSGSSVSHVYSSAGGYQVWLVVNNNSVPACSDSSGAFINVTGIPCVANSNFTVFPSGTPQYWNAQPDFPWNVSNAVWNWGDGSSSNVLYASHTYSAAGTYSICLTVTVNCGGTSSTCVSQYINKNVSPDQLMVHIDVVPPQTISVGIRDSDTESLFYSVYPNPNNGQFSIKMTGLKDGAAFIHLYNIVGERVFESYGSSVNHELYHEMNLPDVSEGIYFLKITSDHKTYTKKMVISK